MLCRRARRALRRISALPCAAGSTGRTAATSPARWPRDTRGSRPRSSLPFVIGRRAALEAALRARLRLRVPVSSTCSPSTRRLSPEDRRHVVYDLGEVRGLDYYTGIHFELFVAGAGRAAGAGGRYDDLMGRFGRPRAGGRRLARPRHDRRGHRRPPGHCEPAPHRAGQGPALRPCGRCFRQAGIALDPDPGRRLLIPSSDPGIEFLVVKPGDVPVYVESAPPTSASPAPMSCGRPTPTCWSRWSSASASAGWWWRPRQSCQWPDLPGGITARVATKYPRLAWRHFGERGGRWRSSRSTARWRSRRCSGCPTGSWTWSTRETRCVPTVWPSGRRSSTCRAVLVANRASQKLKLDEHLRLDGPDRARRWQSS